MNKITLLITILSITTFYSSFSQNPEWKAYCTSTYGLESNFITTIAIDSAGNKWIGTEWGIAKYDSINWTTYKPTNTNLPNEVITSIAAVDSETVWVGTKRGFARFDGTTWTNYIRASDPYFDSYIYSIFVDHKKNIWFGTKAGILKFDGIEFSVICNNFLKMNPVYSIAEDSSGRIWYLTNNYGKEILVKMENLNETYYFKDSSGLPDYFRFHCIAIDKEQNKWIGSDGYIEQSKFQGSLVKFKDSSWTLYRNDFHYSIGAFSHLIENIVIDDSNNKWIASFAGAAKFNDSLWIEYTFDNSPLMYPSVNTIAIDKYGNKWIGTYYCISVFREGGVVGVEDASKKNESKIKCEICSNIGENIIQIKYNNDLNEKINLYIYDILGRLVYSENKEPWQLDGINTFSIDMSNMQSGVYYVIINSGKSYNYCNFVFIK